MKSRAALCEAANLLNRTANRARGGAPALTPESDPETIARWLQWCDPNGCHTRDRAVAEGFDPYTDDDGENSAWEALANMLEDA